MTDKLEQLVTRFETALVRLESMDKASSVAPKQSTVPQSETTQETAAEKAYAEVISQLQNYKSLSEKVGGLVATQAGFVEKAFMDVGNLIHVAGKAKKPADDALVGLLKPLQKNIEEIVSVKDKNRPSPLFNHLSAVAEGIPALGWVTVSPTPAPFVEDMKGSAQFYANRVIKDNKEKGDEGKASVEWSNSWVSLLGEVQKYVKQWHTTGLSWNPNGSDAKNITPSISAAATSVPSATASAPVPPSAPKGSSGPPPPPPLPPSDYLDKFTPSNATGSLFDELNKGGAVTAGLKHVDKSQMTHKNPALRASSVVPSTTSSASVSEKAKLVTVKPPRMEKDGNKWFIENYVGNSEIVLAESDVDLKTSIYVYGLKNCGVKIDGKVNAITMGTLIFFVFLTG
jgi:adenylyl cyclase-associated protein